jgi:hypothetical protein
MLFTKPYIEAPAGIFVTNKIEGPIELSNCDKKKVSISIGYGMQDYLETHHPKIELYLISDILTGLHRVSSGISEAFIKNVVLAIY